jgi:hypothetical protein
MIQTVEITISGGAVQHVEFPRGFRVIIRDYDVEGSDVDSGFDIRKDSEGDHYQHMEFEREQDALVQKEAGGNLSQQQLVAEDTSLAEHLITRQKTASTPLYIDMSNVDWRLLRKQKLALLTVSHLISKAHPHVGIENIDHTAIDGLINFLDFIQDCAAEIIGEEEVFGKEADPEIAQQSGVDNVDAPQLNKKEQDNG